MPKGVSTCASHELEACFSLLLSCNYAQRWYKARILSRRRRWQIYIQRRNQREGVRICFSRWVANVQARVIAPKRSSAVKDRMRIQKYSQSQNQNIESKLASLAAGTAKLKILKNELQVGNRAKAQELEKKGKWSSSSSLPCCLLRSFDRATFLVLFLLRL